MINEKNNTPDKLREAYDPESFRKLGHQLVDLLADYLQAAAHEEIPANAWQAPDDQLAYWQQYEVDPATPLTLFEDILERSIHLHHPHYIGHQICPTAPLSALAGLVSGLLNNGMAVYEMGAAATAIEKVVVDTVLQKLGFNSEASGFLTSGGTLANLTALLAARSAMVPSDIWQTAAPQQLAVMVASEAHYCIDRAVRIMGWGAAGMIKIPVGDNFKMQTELLEAAYQKAKAQGIKVIAVVGSAPSTSAGMYDDLEAIGQFCTQRKLWFHVDGAHGGAAIFSNRYRHLLAGIEQADSVVIDGHKMLMTPSLMTFLLFKNKNQSFATFRQKAQYLIANSQEQEWFTLAQRTFECTKSMMSIKFYTLLKIHGEALFDQSVTHLYDLGKIFAEKVADRSQFELALSPDCNIVCFRYWQAGRSDQQLDHLNHAIRDQILKDGKFYIVQTKLKDIVYLRTTFMNPQTTPMIMETLLDEIEAIAKQKQNGITVDG
ncbi:MAG: aspartate aminotransferase family protein [Saprospiraceae bacterium]